MPTGPLNSVIEHLRRAMLRDSATRYAADHYSFLQRHAALGDPHGYSQRAWRDYAQFGWLALRWSGAPSYERIGAFARAVTLALKRTIEAGRPVYLILDGDVAQTVGGILKEDWAIASEVLVIDGIALRDFDYIDLGRIRMPSHTVPVTIKSLVFSQDPRVPHEQRHQHHHGHHHH